MHGLRDSRYTCSRKQLRPSLLVEYQNSEVVVVFGRNPALVAGDGLLKLFLGLEKVAEAGQQKF